MSADFGATLNFAPLFAPPLKLAILEGDSARRG